MAYAPAGATAHLALVGKGITFDSGGLSLKPPTGMAAMKMDMAGAAAVLGAVRAIALLEVPVRVTAYLAVAENMPSGSAQRPGDVITAYGGRTVEVLNTDAEGRLVMMDALVRCGEDGPDAVIDIATLTGAQLVALGSRIAGAMGNDDAWRDEVVAAATAAGELVWPMPIPEELRASLDSPVADLANIGERNGGMMTAAAFLREFVPDGVRWTHLDIAGPAFNEGSAWGPFGKGGTGFGVRTLVAVAERMAAAPD
jgi:leucyl aminopeptidase